MAADARGVAPGPAASEVTRPPSATGTTRGGHGADFDSGNFS